MHITVHVPKTKYISTYYLKHPDKAKQICVYGNGLEGKKLGKVGIEVGFFNYFLDAKM